MEVDSPPLFGHWMSWSFGCLRGHGIRIYIYIYNILIYLYIYDWREIIDLDDLDLQPDETLAIRRESNAVFTTQVFKSSLPGSRRFLVKASDSM